MRVDGFTDLGVAANFTIAENPDSPDTLRFVFHSDVAGKQSHHITPGLARFMWFNLTQILFPRAAEQLTSRAPTVSLTPAKSLTVMFAAEIWKRDKDRLIEITAINAVGGWSICVTPDEAHQLWASLEHVLGIVGGGGANDI